MSTTKCMDAGHIGGGGYKKNDEGRDPGEKSGATVATLNSSPWISDNEHGSCTSCGAAFGNAQQLLGGGGNGRRHHCRLCGRIFCQSCSSRRALIPPTDICLHPSASSNGSGPVNPQDVGISGSHSGTTIIPPGGVSWESRGGEFDNMNSSVVLLGTHQTKSSLLYARGLEQRCALARQPLRVCDRCHDTLEPLQGELCATNSNAVRFNSIDPSSFRRLCNSPLAFTLGHEIRKVGVVTFLQF